MFSHKRYRKWFVCTIVERYSLLFRTGQPNHVGDRKTSGVMTVFFSWENFGSVAFLSAATFYQKNPDSKHKPLSSVSSEKYTLRMQLRLECCYIRTEGIHDILYYYFLKLALWVITQAHIYSEPPPLVIWVTVQTFHLHFYSAEVFL